MKKRRKRKKSIGCVGIICWIIVPTITLALILLDGFELYLFTCERLIVFGAGVVVLLFPFLSEINIKNFSLKKDDKSSQ